MDNVQRKFPTNETRPLLQDGCFLVALLNDALITT